MKTDEDIIITCDIPAAQRAAVRLPPFWPDKPSLWFALAEAQFQLGGITNDATKFNYAVCQLDRNCAEEVEDIITQPPTAGQRYETLKVELIRRLSAYREKQVGQPQVHDDIGNRKPSQIFSRGRNLAGADMPHDTIRSRWSNCRTTLTTNREPFDNGSPSGPIYSPSDSLHSLVEDCSRIEQTNKRLNELGLCKEEPFSDWPEEKVDLSILEQYPALQKPIRACPVEVPTVPLSVQAPPYNSDLHYAAESVPQHHYGEQPRTQVHLRELGKVYVAVEAMHLPPPQNPPGPATELLLRLQASYVAQQQNCAEQPAASVIVSWRRPETEPVVDENARNSAGAPQTRAPHAAASPRSPPTSSSTSPASQSPARDEEWAPRGVRCRPYARFPDYSHRKEQNKNASTRYRQRKRAELEVLLAEEKALRQRHGELQTKCSGMQRKISCFKDLVRDVFQQTTSSNVSTHQQTGP